MNSRIFYITGLILFAMNVFAQENSGWQIGFRTDLYSRHLWRGDKLGGAPAIEPEISLSKDNFGFTIWGASTFDNSYEELDLILSYLVLPSLNLVFYDYYNPVPGEENSYWKYSGDNLRHTLELTGEFEKQGFPLTILTGVFLYGDKDIVDGKEQFSTYIEPVYHLKLAGKNFRTFAGFTPFKGYYADKFAFVNLGFAFSDSYPIGEKLEIPLEINFCTNPYKNNTWFVVGIGIKNKE